jgi:hypothetical protein
MRQAQSQAQQKKESWQASFKEEDEIVKWAVHRTEDAPDAYWEEFPESIQIDPESNLPELGDVYRVRFNYKGCPVYNPSDSCTNTTIRTKGRLTLSLKNGGATKRCVIVSTLLGALRAAQEQSTPDNGKYCY